MIETPVDAQPSRAASAQRRGRTFRRLSRDKMAVAGFFFVVLLIGIAIFASWVAPYDPNRQDLLSRFQSPSRMHYLGTDSHGRDVFSRLIFGTRVSLVAGLVASATAAGLGVPMGLIAGYVGGKIDAILSFVNDALMSVPPLIFALAMIAALGPGLVNAMLVIGIIASPRFFRLTRLAAKDLSKETFSEGCIAIGCSRARTVLVHILPNAIPTLVVQATFVFGTAILAEASLSYLGLGVGPPTASWGSMLSEAVRRLDLSYLVWGPGVALTLTVLSVGALGDGWRDALGLTRMDKGA